MKKILALALLTATTYVQADWLSDESDSSWRMPKSSFDYQSGNSYTTSYLGDTAYVSGFNYNTGSVWNTTIESDGDMRGLDSNLNPWSYNASSGTYINYGTGKFCTGSGYSRICSE